MKILYFTGTGNCLAVAKRFDAELLSVPKMIQNNQYLIEDNIVGIVYPVYAVSVPNIIKRYFKKCKIKADYTFVIATYGFTDCGSLHEMKNILKLNGNSADYYQSIKMVDNYLPLFDIDKQLSMIKEKNTENNLAKIVEEINQRVKRRENCGLFNNFITTISSNIIGNLEKYTPKTFSVNDKCTGCGVCKQICPVSNIKQTKKPVFGLNCESCLACIHNCPQNAIQMSIQKSEKRYKNSDVSLKEIINSNNQI